MRGITTRLSGRLVHDRIDLDIYAGEIFALVGGSGTGKTTLLHEMIMLRRPDAGSLYLWGQDLAAIDEHQKQALRRKFGVLFQHGALFSSLTVLENVAVPLHEHTRLDPDLIDEVARVKILQVGLPADAAGKYPRELSGGMIKRAALARAMALDPQLLFLDEPTSGLDPHSAGAFDELVLRMKQWFGLTVVMVTHDLDTLWQAADRVAVLGEGHVLAVGDMQSLSQEHHPLVRQFFEGPRARQRPVK
jgi:phospholipid/cholesterol/gamma-HCH transport system ATP-binding protein